MLNKLIKFFKSISTLKKFVKTFFSKKFIHKVTNSSYFWRFRHLYDPRWIESYDCKSTNNYLLEFVSSKKVSSVLDFGCGTGNFLYDLTKQRTPNTLFTVLILAQKR